MSKFCSSCGSANADNAIRCSRCGKALMALSNSNVTVAKETENKKSSFFSNVLLVVIGAVIFFVISGDDLKQIFSKYTSKQSTKIEQQTDYVRESPDVIEESGDATSEKSDLPKEPVLEETGSASDGLYGYECLDAESKKVYDIMLDGIYHHKECIRLPIKNDKKIEKIFSTMLQDYGDLFWICPSKPQDGQYYYYSTREYNFYPNYTMNIQKQIDYERKLGVAAEKMLSGISNNASDYEKAVYIFRKMVDEITYVENSLNNQNILSALLDKKTVCQGYACAANYLFREVGIPCSIVIGTADGESHAWNLIYLNGEYYYMDVTWGDTDRKDYRYNYRYFATTTKELFMDHNVERNPFKLPNCTSTNDSYFIKENAYFKEWKPKKIGNKIREDYKNKVKQRQFKFTSVSLMKQAKSYFLDNNHWWDYSNGKEVSYWQDKEAKILTFYYKY